MLYIDDPFILFQFNSPSPFVPSNQNTFDENMNVLARYILFYTIFMSFYEPDIYQLHVRNGLVILFLLTFFIFVAELDSEGLSPTRLTTNVSKVGEPIVFQSPSYEQNRGGAFFRQSNPYQQQRPYAKKNKLQGLFFNDF